MKRSWIADLCLLFVAFVWGSTFIIVQAAVQILPPLTFNAVRFLSAAGLFVLVLLIKERTLKRLFQRKLWLHGGILGVVLFGGYAFQTIGLLHTTTTNTGFITGLSVVLVPFITVWMNRTRLSLQTWIAAIAALFGLYLLTFNGSEMAWNQGDLLVLICAVCFALQIALTGKFANLHDTLVLVTVQLGTVGILAAVSGLIFEPVLTPAAMLDVISDPTVLAALLVSICLSTAFAFWAQTWAQRYTSAARVAIIYAMEPVFAAITGVTFAHEQLGTYAVLGCTLILVSMLATELKWKPSKLRINIDKANEQ